MIKKTNNVIVLKTYFQQLKYYEYNVYFIYKLFNIFNIKVRKDKFTSIDGLRKYSQLIMNPNYKIKELLKTK